MFVAREIKQKLLRIFLWAPCTPLNSILLNPLFLFLFIQICLNSAGGKNGKKKLTLSLSLFETFQLTDAIYEKVASTAGELR